MSVYNFRGGAFLINSLQLVVSQTRNRLPRVKIAEAGFSISRQAYIMPMMVLLAELLFPSEQKADIGRDFIGFGIWQEGLADVSGRVDHIQKGRVCLAS